jgi:hypothetical protein
VEGTLTLSNSNGQPLSKNLQAAVVWQFEVVHTRHDAGKVVIGSVRRFTGTTDNGEDRGETLETWKRNRKLVTIVQLKTKREDAIYLQ